MRYYSLVFVLVVVLAVVVNGSEYKWYPVTVADILVSKPEIGVTTTTATDPTTSGVIVRSIITGSGGCNEESHVFVKIMDSIGYKNGDVFKKFEKIRYTLQFMDAASCWSILGNTQYGSFGANFKTGLHEFDITNSEDKILYKDLYGSYNGETVRCDNENDNFWSYVHCEDSCYLGSLRVEQRRDENVDVFDAGIGIGFTCAGSRTTVWISEIQVGYT